MANRMKEDQRIEKIIRGLLRHPNNRRCMNCNSLGPQYVCTTFLTFVCTNCSGVHREFTHRVKSVSMAKFSAEEVSALQAGGNERARQIYFKEWDPQRHSYPDGSNLHRIRDFIKHVYVDRKYTGDKSSDKLPRLRLNDKEETNESRKVVAYRGGSRSPSSEERYKGHHSKRISSGGRSDDGSFKYYYDERRSPRYPQENSRHGGPRRSSARFEVVDDRFRDDEHGSRRLSNTESKLVIRSPDIQKNVDRSLSPVVPPVGDILGDNVHPLQNITSTSDQGSVDKNPAEHKRRNSASLIDFNADSEPLDAATVPQTQLMLHSDNGGNFGRPAMEKPSQAPSSNTLESLLFELSVPSDVPASNISEGPRSDDLLSTATGGDIPAGGVSLAASEHLLALTISVGASTTASTINMPAQPYDAPSGIGGSIINILDKEQLPNMQQYHPTASPVADSSSVTQQTRPPVGAVNNQLWFSSTLPNSNGPLSASAEQSSQSVSNSAQETSSGVGFEPLPEEAKSIGRKELPVDLFTLSYSTVPAPVPGWQNGSPYGMGFNMQYYPNPMPVPVFPNIARSTNPFDLNDERAQVQAPPFPTMVSFQGALPNLSAGGGLLQTSSLGTQSLSLMAPQSPSYASAVPPCSPPGANMGLQVHNNMTPSRLQGVGSFGNDGDIFGSLNTTQQSTGKNSATSNSNPFSSMGGNPFG
ncbi:probable ADP-ribosylation factor GTPase-activating protein AGD14 [Fagus crenata]